MSQLQDINFSLESVPHTQRQGFIVLAFIMLGFTYFSASMLAGGHIGTGLALKDFLIAIILGNAFLAIYTALLGSIGVKTGLTTHLLARYAFGYRGSWLASLLLSGTQVIWFGVGIAMFATPISEITGINLYALVALTGVIMTGTMYFGISAIAALSIIAVPTMTILGIYSIGEAINTAGDLSSLSTMNPINPMTMTTAFNIVIGSFISGGTLTADFLRFGHSVKIAIIVSMLAFFVGNSLMFIFGAIGTLALGEPDIFDVMLLQGLIMPAIVILGLNIWTNNNNALYSAGLGFSNITEKSSRSLSMILGSIGTLCSLWIYENFIIWLVFLSSTIPPIGAILIADYFLKRKRYANFSQMNDIYINFNAIIAVMIGIIVSFTLDGLIPINAIISTLITYILLETTLGSRMYMISKKLIQ